MNRVGGFLKETIWRNTPKTTNHIPPNKKPSIQTASIMPTPIMTVARTWLVMYARLVARRKLPVVHQRNALKTLPPSMGNRGSILKRPKPMLA